MATGYDFQDCHEDSPLDNGYIMRVASYHRLGSRTIFTVPISTFTLLYELMSKIITKSFHIDV